MKTAIVKNESGKEETWWVMNPKDLCITTDSAIPSKELQLSVNTKSIFSEKGNTQWGIAPMQVVPSQLKTQDAVHTVTIQGGDDVTYQHFQVDKVITKNVPTAMWGTKFKPEVNDPGLVKDVSTGLQIKTKKPDKVNDPTYYGDTIVLQDPSCLNTDLQQLSVSLDSYPAVSLPVLQPDDVATMVQDKTPRASLAAAFGITHIDISTLKKDDFIFAPAA